MPEKRRAVPGRKTDVNDAQWLQRLHACGLLRASFHHRGLLPTQRRFSNTSFTTGIAEKTFGQPA